MLSVAKCLYWFEIQGEKGVSGVGCVGSVAGQ